jgi:hypothetical protein
MAIEPQRHFINPGDNKIITEASFSLAELKTLQGVLIKEIQRAAEEENAEYKDNTDLAKKLEYFISE